MKIFCFLLPIQEYLLSPVAMNRASGNSMILLIELPIDTKVNDSLTEKLNHYWKQIS